MNIAEPVLAGLADGNGPAFDFDGMAIPRDAAIAHVRRRAHELREAGVSPGELIFVAGGRGGAFWLDAVAVWAVGAIYAPVDADAPAPETVRRLTVRGVIGHGDAVACLPDGILHFGDAPPDGDAPPPACANLGPEALSAILFTSGSTGEPKAVALSHHSVLGNARGTAKRLGYASDEKLFIAIPFRFVSALSHAVVTMLEGATLAGTERRLPPADLARRIVETGATAFGGGPLQLRWLVGQDAARASGLRWAMSSGDHLGLDLIHALRRDWPALRVHTVYGMTELGGRICMLPPEALDDYAGSVGIPIDGLSVRILDENGAPVPRGEIGEVHVEGDLEMAGYVGRPDATAETLTAHGVRTGDTGRFDEEGRLWLSGRADDQFKVMGHKVSPFPIVEALMETGMVRDAVVVPVEHARLGTVPRAFYIAHPDNPFDMAAVTRHLRARVPAHWIPQGFVAIDAIPRTASGKLDRKALAALTVGSKQG